MTLPTRITATDPEARSADPIAGNITRLKALFPEAVTEGRIDFEVLKQLLGGAVDEREEKYGLTWHGKRQARQVALTPSLGTLRPCPEESVDWETTKNLMIEGDNLEVLKLLQKSYAGKVKLIYIDPPYNTGEDFVYQDNFQDNIRNYLELTGQLEGGRKVVGNADASGRFHTKWLNMIYPRLKIARDLLRQDGVIFVSIDDGEVAHLRVALNEVFGEENFEGHIHWRRRHNQPNDTTKMIALVAEHVLVYARDKIAYRASGVGKLPLTGDFSNPDGDPRGDWASKPWKAGADQSGSRYKITTASGKIYDEEWMGDEATYRNLLEDKRIIFPDKGNGAPRKKYFKVEREQEGQCATNWWSHEVFGHNQGANSDMWSLLGQKNIFSNPKPIELIDGFLNVGNVRGGDIVLDFFAGSGVTGHAVMAKNFIDAGNRRYILVQLPERLDPEEENQKIAAGYCGLLKKPRTIAELTKERLRRAGDKIKADNPDFTGDLGFRVFKLDASNIATWEPRRDDLAGSIQQHIDHLKPGRTPEDLLFEILLKYGLDLSSPITVATVGGFPVHRLGGGVLTVCLADGITADRVEALGRGLLADLADQGVDVADARLVFKDHGFADDVAKANLTALLTQGGIRLDHLRTL